MQSLIKIIYLKPLSERSKIFGLNDGFNFAETMLGSRSSLKKWQVYNDVIGILFTRKSFKIFEF